MQRSIYILLLVCIHLCGSAIAEEAWPALIEKNGSIDIPGQPSPFHGNAERTIKVYVTYPEETIESVNKDTGLLLALHNWGGKGGQGAPIPSAKDFNLVVIFADYLDTGLKSRVPEQTPYDHGYFQGLDAIRSLYYIYNGLKTKGIAFDEKRLYCTGGSGGGNVTLMVNKLAPRTLACAVDVSGMALLNDDIAFNLKGGSGLRAGFSQEPEHKNYLSKDAQLIRDPGYPPHLQAMKALGCSSMLVVIHGEKDHACLIGDKKNLVANYQQSKLNIDPHLLTEKDIDGEIIKDVGHGIGSRTELFKHFAGKYIDPSSPDMLRREGNADFDYRDEKVVYPTPNGKFIISYKLGYPVGRFESK